MDHSHHGHHGHEHHAPAAVATAASTVAATVASLLGDAAVTATTTEMPPMDNPCAHMDMGHHMMSMTFHFGYCEDVLFEGWKIRSVGTLIGSMVGILIMAALYEGLKYYREYLFWSSNNAIQYRSVTPPEKGPNSCEGQRTATNMIPEIIHHQPPSMLSSVHGLQTCLHVIQIILSYFLMLIFMTYNVWLCIAVVVGAAIGYFLFGWKKSVIVDVTEHCH